ncbi:WAT1-related protein At3g28050-like isoform X2 [Ziziphus jujuba]|uniref:WAT1-related protein At3g28050-like isoform X2 n=1 Tax=Ziziphus jujuba TaxID=326968 RepID=A0ABM3ZXU4_ZIZJJ|nr:WAT1-related protein At3g28050-like isoform X2 [Ziziphus jujuba]
MEGLGITEVMVMIECLQVVLHTLTKAATNTGMSEFVFVFYSNALCLFFLLPTCSFFYCRVGTCPTPMYRVVGKMFLFGLLRKEDLTKKSSQAKSVGTVISIAGALIVTLSEGVPLTSASPLPRKLLDQLLSSVQSKWVIVILLLQSFFHALTFVVQSWVMREYSKEPIANLTDYPAEYPAELIADLDETLTDYPAEYPEEREYPAELISTLREYLREYTAELIATLFCCISMTIISAIGALIAERSNPDAWQIKSNMELIAIGFNAVFAIAFGKGVHLRAVRTKGPLYRAAFKPLRTVIAFIFGIIFQGETVYLGGVIGGAIVIGGFFAVICGKAQEDEDTDKAQEDEEDMGKAQEDEEDMGKAQEDEEDMHQRRSQLPEEGLESVDEDMEYGPKPASYSRKRQSSLGTTTLHERLLSLKYEYDS